MKAMLRGALILMTLSAAVIAQDTRYNFDSQADFSKYKTYKWVAIPGTEKLDDLIDGQIKSSLDAELAKKGLTKVDGDNADLLIGYQPSINTEKQVNTYDTGWGYGPGWRGYGYGGGGGGMSTSTTSTLYVGSLALDMYDPSKKNWSGGESLRRLWMPRLSPKNDKRTYKRLLPRC